MVGMRTRLAIERAGTVTPHLKRGAPVLYPNPNGNGEQWIGRTYGAMAPVLDPTRGSRPSHGSNNVTEGNGRLVFKRDLEFAMDRRELRGRSDLSNSIFE